MQRSIDTLHKEIIGLAVIHYAVYMSDCFFALYFYMRNRRKYYGTGYGTKEVS